MPKMKRPTRRGTRSVGSATGHEKNRLKNPKGSTAQQLLNLSYTGSDAQHISFKKRNNNYQTGY
jgi:hypothetical protein